MASLRLFFDSMSQPCRSVMMLLKQNNIAFVPELVKIAKGEQLTNEEFGNASIDRKVPAIIDGDFKLSESEAIMKYICTKHNLPDHWYPKDLEKRAKIDEYLGWHHTNLRIGSYQVIWGKVFNPILLGQPVDEKKAESGLNRLMRCFTVFDNHFLKKTPFISSEEISIADLMAICEFSQLELVEKGFVKLTPSIETWIRKCKNQLGNNYDDVHSILNIMKKKVHPEPKL